MHFLIGTREYIVRRRWNLAMDQDKVDGLCDGTNHYIWLDGDVEEGALVDLLRHEHNHAWEFETAVPRTQEERANFNSTVGAAFDRDFRNAGGLRELLAIRIEGYPPGMSRSPVSRPAYDFNQAMRCGGCGTLIAQESIFNGDPEYVESERFYLMYRGCACPVCPRVQVWNEKCTANGSPLGIVFKPRTLRGEDAEQWKKRHAECVMEYEPA